MISVGKTRLLDKTQTTPRHTIPAKIKYNGAVVTTIAKGYITSNHHHHHHYCTTFETAWFAW